MKLIFVRNSDPKLVGQEVKVGHTCQTFRGEEAVVDYFRPPTSPSSEGKVVIHEAGERGDYQTEVYVGVIGATWVEREDRDD